MTQEEKIERKTFRSRIRFLKYVDVNYKDDSVLPPPLSENSTVLPLINISSCTCIYAHTWKRERVQVGVFQDLFVSCKSRESSLELKIIVQLESLNKKKKPLVI